MAQSSFYFDFTFINLFSLLTKLFLKILYIFNSKTLFIKWVAQRKKKAKVILMVIQILVIKVLITQIIAQIQNLLEAVVTAVISKVIYCLIDNFSN